MREDEYSNKQFRDENGLKRRRMKLRGRSRWFLATVEFATDVRTIRNVQTEAEDRTIRYAGCVRAIIYESITYLPNFWSTDSKWHILRLIIISSNYSPYCCRIRLSLIRDDRRSSGRQRLRQLLPIFSRSRS